MCVICVSGESMSGEIMSCGETSRGRRTGANIYG